MVIFAAPLTFMTSLIGDLIVLFLWGLAFGGFWIMITPTYSDVIDESVVESGRRKESTYGGLRQFFVNLARVIYLAIGVLIFWKFYDLTPDKVKENKAKIIQMNL